ncbi:MAG: efflux RND transporter periplasmic adaptor subunit [Rhodoplanes sp.]
MAAALALAACGDDQTRAQPEPPPPAVVVAAVEQRDINPKTEHVGQTVAVDTVELRARVQAFLTRRVFREGEDVKQGALLFTLERPPFEAAVDAAAGQAAQARAEVVRTRRDLERARTLHQRGNVSQQALDRAISDQEQAEATLRASEAQLRQAQIDLGYTQITAPFDGRIGRSVYSVGQWVGPDSGVLATLVKLDPIYVVFNVSERSYLDYQKQADEAVRAGRPRQKFVPRLRLSNGAEYPHPGRFDFVDNRVDPTTGTIAVRAVFPNPDKLLVPGLFVTVVLRSTEPKPALLIPQAAVQEDQGGRFVLVVGPESKAEVRRIETGARIGISWEVTSGLAEGERVIYEGLQKVQAGSVVAPTERPLAAPAG